jgi:hypothetical protein
VVHHTFGKDQIDGAFRQRQIADVGLQKRAVQTALLEAPACGLDGIGDIHAQVSEAWNQAPEQLERRHSGPAAGVEQQRTVPVLGPPGGCGDVTVTLDQPGAHPAERRRRIERVALQPFVLERSRRL